jgi:PAS domain S-box-containing protein
MDLEGLRWVFAGSSDLVFATDLAGTVVFVNPAAAPRWSPHGRAAELFPGDERASFEAAHARAVTHRESASFEWGDDGVAGATSWYLCTVSPLLAGDQVAGTLCISSSVVELKRSEQRSRRSEQLMVDTAGVAHLGTWEWDISLPNATWSEELYRIYGLTPETYTPSYEAYLTMVHPDDRQRVIDATNRVFHEHVPYSHDERIFRGDGTMRYLHTWAHPVLDETGTLRRLIGVCQDITEQKRAEEEVRELNVELERRVADRTHTIERSMRDLEMFSSMVSHDLRAPISVIKMCADLVTRQTPDLPETVAIHIERIQRSVSHMTELVDDLLTLARVGSARLARVDVDLASVAGEVVADLARVDPGRQVAIEIAPRIRGHADAGLIRAVMQNLLANAWKYSSQVDAPRIEVGTVESASGHAVFVRDNGAGFDMDEAHRLFVPFERLHASAEFSGTGVGLAIVHRILERHGGRIWAESAPGQGATFYFELPG